MVGLLCGLAMVFVVTGEEEEVSHQSRIQFFVQYRLVLDESHSLSEATRRDGLLKRAVKKRCFNVCFFCQREEYYPELLLI